MKSSESFFGASQTTTSPTRWAWVASLAIGAVLAIGATPARADLADLSVVINSNVTGDHVSYSQPAAGKQAALPVWAAFTVDVTNPAPNNVSNAWITFRDSRLTQLKLPPAVVSQGGASGTCAFGADNTTVVCKVSLAGNSVGSLHFVLRALSPTQPVPVPTTPEKLLINWGVQSGQGAAGANPSQVVNQSAGELTLDAGSPTDLKGYIDKETALAVQDGRAVKDGGADGSSTTVAPQDLSFTVQDLKQEVVADSCSSQYKICLQSTLSIPLPPAQTFSPPLIVDLLRAKSTLRGGAKIDNVVLSYSPDSASVALPIIQCNLNGPPTLIGSWSIPLSISAAFAQGRCYIPASPANPFTYVDPATGEWHIRLLEETNGLIKW